MKSTNQILYKTLADASLDLHQMWRARSTFTPDIMAEEMSKYFFLQAELYLTLAKGEENGTNNS